MTETPDERPRVSGHPSQRPADFDPLTALSLGKQGAVDDPSLNEMRKNRRINSQRTGSRGSTNVSFATARPQDPLFYWEQSNLPYDAKTVEGLRKIWTFGRTLYQTHPVIASAIDVFSKYPLTGLELTCQDPALVDFYSTLFLDQLDYEEYLQDIGREHWSVGEAWPLGSFNETLGVWEDDELMNPEDIEVIKSPFLKEPRFQMRIPDTIRRILEDRAPAWEYKQLVEAYPELLNFTRSEARMPVSNTLLKQIKFKGDTFNPRGVPILMRAFRAVTQEELLNLAQDGISSRMYTPLVLAKLGASANELGTQQPWIPTEDDLATFEEAVDAALSGDFRMLTYHFAVQMDLVFGRENMPNLNQDFERLTDRILQVFGLSRSMLTGAEAGKTYASDSINRDLISQLLTSYQRKIKKFFRERALVVAEAQEHYDYEVRGGKRYPIMEEVLEVDPESGEQRIIEQPKLLVPDLHIKAMTMKDETDMRQFLEALRAGGVPISMKTRLINVPIDLDEERDRARQEAVDMAVEAQETRKQTYETLRDRGLPIPEDLIQDFQPKAHVSGSPNQQQGAVTDPVEQNPPLPSIGTLPVDDTALVPTAEDGMGVLPGVGQSDEATVIALPRNQMDRTRPPESDEERAIMPKPASVVGVNAEGQHYVDVYTTAAHTEGEGEEAKDVVTGSWSREEVDISAGAQLLTGPRHLGMRRYAQVDKTTDLDEYRQRRQSALSDPQ